MSIKKIIVTGIGSGIGIASEAIADRKERKAQREGRSPSPNPLAAPKSRDGRSVSPHPLTTSRSKDEKDSSSDTEDDDELEWALDDAAREVTSPPAYENIGSDVPVDSDLIANNFLQSHGIFASSEPQQYKPLPAPVILPQRRPKDKMRGFVRAYAPVLGECSGIDQQTFLDFLETFDKASKASPVFDVINIAAFAVGLVPNPIAMGVSVAVQVVVNTGKEIQSRYRRNDFLNMMNETFFKPRGLFSMLMAFKPDAAPVFAADVTSSDRALVKILSIPDSEIQQKLRSLRLHSGVTKGEISLPEAAPLIYPALDNLMVDEQTTNKLKSSTNFLGSYFDRRAQALYGANNPNSKLAVPPPEKPFASRYSDPNHLANAGTLWALVTGGRFDPIADKRARKAQRRAERRGIVLTEEEIHNAKMGRRLKPERGGRRQPLGPVYVIKKVLKKDVLYLTIVNLPSEGELREVRQALGMEGEREVVVR